MPIGREKVRTPLGRALVAPLAAALLAGCSAAPDSRRAHGPVQAMEPHPASDAAPMALALPGPEIAAYEQHGSTLPHWERFEFSRRDALVSPAGDAPLLATLQWPQVPPPPERRVRFFIWRQ
ncbi:MAG: hypothetical protein SFZ24_06865 [Planctomycetota bacterium]|nr:hypothetical protein [Planctomycetota bacterium]